MPKPSENPQTYFGKEHRRRLVEDFIVSKINGVITLDTTKVVTINKRERLQAEINADHASAPEHYRTTTERATWESRYSDKMREIQATPYLMTEERIVQDERFSRLDSHIEMYLSPDTTDTGKRLALSDIYMIILRLKGENRIKGEFKLQPFREAEIETLNKRMDNLEKRLGSTNRMLERLVRGQ